MSVVSFEPSETLKAEDGEQSYQQRGRRERLCVKEKERYKEDSEKNVLPAGVWYREQRSTYIRHVRVVQKEAAEFRARP